MNLKKTLILGFCLTLIYALAVPAALLADEHDQITKLTFNEPVEVPGHVLTPGTYWFALFDSPANRNIVQIWNEDRSQLIATIIAVPDYRLQPTGKTVVNFEERPTDQPEAIQAWFYPGENFGHEFVYPKTRATALARQTSQPVPAMPDESSTDTASAPMPPINAVTSSGDEVELSEIVESEQPQERVVLASLPQTASLAPLWALLGVIAIIAFVYFRRIGNKTFDTYRESHTQD